ncbi:Sensory histidine kinase/phosphatase NtrB [Vibrio stylophorae]|uniref:Sensory histidine kinase/phosphatase NtrB n=1 Tax=Vibrio stylophorae TaxID=659351 RepID=A0ABM8ZPT6_9VIBR|nr:nitrogen regulation protein NR(II) [Vibrio stylophorae]CAH0532323.1 Sensory histidine kinase/phosphatase NtrB [Vibrio stylophorae]
MLDPYQQIFHHQRSGMLLLNAQLTVLKVNASAEQLFGLSGRRLCQQPIEQLLHHPELTPSHLRQTIDHLHSFTCNEVSLKLAGQWLLLDITVTAFAEAQQRYLLLELRPVDQQRKLSHEAMQSAQQQAAKELVRGLAHEIKNPLGGLRGAAQLLEKTLPTPDLKEYTQIIMSQADRLRDLVDRLLGPQRPSRFIATNIHLVLEQVRQLIQLQSPHIELTRDYDPSLPDIAMDPHQIEQVLLNIASNAAIALGEQPNSQITLRTRTAYHCVLHGQQHKLVAQIDIIDNGPGIPAQIQDTLFYPMVSGRADGTGLGLSIANNLIDQHHGKITVTSTPGETCFSIFLPLTESSN